jgi:hypothetical protein
VGGCGLRAVRGSGCTAVRRVKWGMGMDGGSVFGVTVVVFVLQGLWLARLS